MLKKDRWKSIISIAAGIVFVSKAALAASSMAVGGVFPANDYEDYGPIPVQADKCGAFRAGSTELCIRSFSSEVPITRPPTSVDITPTKPLTIQGPFGVTVLGR